MSRMYDLLVFYRLPQSTYLDIQSGEREQMLNYPVEARVSGINVTVVDSDGNDKITDIYVDGDLIGKSPLNAKIPLCSGLVEARLGDLLLQKNYLSRNRKFYRLR